MFAPWQTIGTVRPEMNRLRQEMSRLFDRFGMNDSPMASRNVYPLLNLWEDEGNFYVEAELPGLSLNDLEIYVTGGNTLSLKGERKLPDRESGAWHRRERGYGTFGRLVEIPSPVDSEKVTAEFQHGVLTIVLPKREEARPRRIEIKGNGGNGKA